MNKNFTIAIIVLLLAKSQVYSQVTTKVKIGGNVAYHIGTNAQQNNNSPLLFLKNGQSVGLDLTIVPTKGTTRLKLAADYIIGTNNENAVKAYAKGNNIDYTSYRFVIPRPSGFSIMASPQFMLFPKSKRKKLPLIWLDFPAGVMVSNQQTLQFFLAQTIPSKEIKSNAVSFVYNPSLVVNVVKTGKLFINLKAGYSNYGGIGFGVSITEQDCRGAPCFRCRGTFCNP
jgi:hypothetical protein